MENRDYDDVVGNRHAPFFSNVLVPQAALLTNSHAVEHPSQPNYLDLFSGSNQGVRNDSCPHTFTTDNIASRLITKGLSFGGFAESMPSTGYVGCSFERIYARKHVPWVNFSNVPASSNLPYTGLPAQLPSLMWITPNMCNDMHDCKTQVGDDWLKANAPQIISWNAKHNGLLIVTWDESDFDFTNHIPTLLIGPMIQPGRYRQRVTHFNVLRTIETIFEVPCIAHECGVEPITGVWH